MTLKTSFFNKGIYKSTLKRYMWGAVLYFVLLFLAGGLSVLMNASADRIYSYYRDFLSGEHMFIPILMAVVVPTITALLAFRYVHSKPQAIFTYGLPVTRSAGFVSTFFGGLTLMIVPVVLNGLILLAISRGGYDWYLSVGDCFAWMGYNILGLFMLFSCALFSVSITGNAFSGVIINILLHSFLSLGVAAFEVMADTFIYGFTHDNALSTVINESNFIVVLFGFTDEYFRENLTAWDFAVYIGASVILCALSYVLLLKRKVQTVSEVAGFGCLNGIFKYAITLFAALLAFGMASDDMTDNPFGFAVIVGIVSMIAYTAAEMLIRKKLNVFYSWKGYVCFCVVFGLIVVLFASTSFFGYETRIPSKSDIRSVSVHIDFQDEEAYVSDAKLFESVAEIHSKLIENIPEVYTDDGYVYGYSRYIYISYKLKSGGTVARRYRVSDNDALDIISRLYENEAYKKIHEPAFTESGDVVGVKINVSRFGGDIEGFLDALRTDILKLEHKSIHPEEYPRDYTTLYNLSLEYEESSIGHIEGEKIIRTYEMNITSDFENTVAYLKQVGF